MSGLVSCVPTHLDFYASQWDIKTHVKNLHTVRVFLFAYSERHKWLRALPKGSLIYVEQLDGYL